MSCLSFATVDGRWRPGIGDPSFMGWLTVAAYLAGALLCWRACCSARRREKPMLRLAFFWCLLAIGMFVLGINKQLDLQSLFTQVGRDIAFRDGWYAQRGAVQRAFIFGLLALAFFSVAALLWILRAHLREIWLAGLGAGFIATFVVVRASSFHHVDLLLRTYVAGVKVNWFLELGGIGMVAVSAWAWRRRRGSAFRRLTVRCPWGR